MYPIRCVWRWEGEVQYKNEPSSSILAPHVVPREVEQGSDSDSKLTNSTLEVTDLALKTSAVICKIMVSAPKRNHKKAVTRNLLKRRIRESYRLNKAPITELLSALRTFPAQSPNLIANQPHTTGAQLHISLSYIAKDVAQYNIIEQAIQKCIEKVTNRISQTTSHPTAGNPD